MAIDIPINGSHSVPETHAPLASLDTVTFSKILDRDPKQISTLLTACKEVGFFYLDISDQYSASMVNNLDKLNGVMKDWFAQSDEAKRKELAISMASHGYKPIGSQAGTHGGRDGWEVLKTGAFELQGRWGLPPVVENNYETFATFQRQCHYMTKVILDRLSTALGYTGANHLNRYHRSDCPSKSACAYLHYIPMDETGGNAGHNMHTDYGTLTLVFAPQWGLQVLSPDSRGQKTDLHWQWVEPRPGCAIVNVADVLRFLTEDKLRSAVHRVLPLPDSDRYSVTYFLRPSDDSEFIDADGKLTQVMDWYDRKNNMYESSYDKQDRSLLVGKLYKGTFENGEETGVKLNGDADDLPETAQIGADEKSPIAENGHINGLTGGCVPGQLKGDVFVGVSEVTEIIAS